MAEKLKLWRCVNPDCQSDPREFESSSPVCPTCGTDQKLCPGAIIPLEQVHYLVNHEGGLIKGGLGPRMVACMPTRNQVTRHATGLTLAVTCSACKATAIFKKHVEDDVLQHVGFIEKKIKAETGETVTQGAKT